MKKLFLFLFFLPVLSLAGGYGSGPVADQTVNLATHKDSISSAIKVILYPHAEKHSGSSFFYSELVTLASAGTRDLLIVTPNSTTKKMHLIGSVGCIFEANVKFYEDTTTSNLGTAVTEFNRNRSSSKTNDGTVTHTPTVSGVGTLLVELQLGNASGNPQIAKFGGDTDQRDEYILDGSASKYMLRVTSAVNDNDCNLSLSWYEHSDSN